MDLQRTEQTSLPEALDLEIPQAAELTIQFSVQLCFGNVAAGGYIAAALQKVAVLYASQHAKLNRQVNIRTSTTTFYRPVLPVKGPFKVLIREIHLGKAWSFLRVELFEGNTNRLVVGTDCNLTDFSIKGQNLDTGWRTNPLPSPINIAKLEQGFTDPNWILYHPAFYADGWISSYASVKFYVPKTRSPSALYREHWLVPGWDCTPFGSRDLSLPEARWTTEMLPFVADIILSPQDDYFGQRLNQPFYLSSSARVLQFAEMQERARHVEGRTNWRELPDKANGDSTRPDGYIAAFAHKHLVNATISMTMEVKKLLPKEGTRWLYVRAEVKKVVEGRQDLQALILDENMDLVAIRTGIEQLVDPTGKLERGTDPEKAKASRL